MGPVAFERQVPVAHGVAVDAAVRAAVVGADVAGFRAETAWAVALDARPDRLAAEAGMSPAQLMLAWVMHNGDVMAIPKAGTLDHVADNAGASDRRLDADTMAALETCFPAPTRKQPLAIV